MNRAFLEKSAAVGMTRRGFVFGSLAASGEALAHGDDLLAPVSFELTYPLTIAKDTGDMALRLWMANESGAAVTLRGLSASHGTGVTIERRKTLFGVEAWQAVRFLRIEPGESVLLAPPDYRITVAAAAKDATETFDFTVTADFGPAGRYDARVTIRP